MEYKTHEADRIGQDFALGLMEYGTWWRRHRRAFWEHFTLAAVERYQPMQRTSALKFARRLLEDPTSLNEHIR